MRASLTLQLRASRDPTVKQQPQIRRRRTRAPQVSHYAFQGAQLGSDSVLVCVKHFAGYGAAHSGRDYDSSSPATPHLLLFYSLNQSPSNAHSGGQAKVDRNVEMGVLVLLGAAALMYDCRCFGDPKGFNSSQ